MAKTVERVKFHTPKIPKVLNVAAYARVSSGKDEMLHSLEAQVRYYSEYIQSHHDWHFCGVYTTPRGRNTVRNQSRFPKKSFTLPAVRCLRFLNLMKIFFSLQFSRS